MNLQKIDHPSVWQGNELLSRPDWYHRLTDTELQELNLLLERDQERPQLVAPSLYRRLVQIQDSLENGCGSTIVHGLDVRNRSIGELSTLFLKVASVVGHPISQSAEGERVFSVRNAGFADDDPRARGPNTNRKLSFHTDRCDVIAFLCIRQAKSGGDNQVVSSPALFNEILRRRPDLLEVLMHPYYYQRHNVDTANDLPFTTQPIFSFYNGHFAANFLRVLIERAYSNPDLPEMTNLQREALDYLESVAAEPEMHVTFRQQPGDMLFLNNWVTLHRRTSFEDYEHPDQRRHILRIWLSMPNSRPLDPMFAGNYGSTAAGAIRGGMRAAT